MTEATKTTLANAMKRFKKLLNFEIFGLQGPSERYAGTVPTENHVAIYAVLKFLGGRRFGQ